MCVCVCVCKKSKEDEVEMNLFKNILEDFYKSPGVLNV